MGERERSGFGHMGRAFRKRRRKGTRDDVNIVIEAGVTAGIAEDGALTLLSPQGAPHFYAPEASAMWIALRQHGGDVRAAAAVLGSAWNADVSAVGRLLRKQVTDWQRAGLVKASPTPVHAS
ncbi:hypothetical protein SHL15_8665 [Streptomyces hygroscopicus subsp. limoneus]|nr:hypothetical protein SHL15_8665 [Streptomyces hygroscopicus subsp. limoneus]